MKHIAIYLLMAAAIVLVSSCASPDHATQQAGAGGESSYYAGPETTYDSWPMRFNVAGTDFTVFEPQCDSWDGHQLAGRCAMAVQGPHDPEASYGVFGFTAITLVDKSDRKATLANFKITSADFPSARNETENYVAALTQNIPGRGPTLSLDHLQTALAVTPPPRADHLNNAPPKIITANRPALLVSIDGPPVWRALPGTDFQRVINTRMLLLRDSGNQYYLHLFDGYLQSASFNGPWTVARQLPAGITAAELAAVNSGQVDLMAGTPDATTQKAPSLATSAVPDIFVSTTPAELVQFQGEPEYAPIPGTALLYASNTSGDVFKSVANQRSYILLSGRWYSASSLKGSWQFVPGNQLPRDFANIPDSSPKENVKASVPGTAQASEALIANSIPESTSVALGNRMQPPSIDGAPQLAPIEGTPLHYVVNSSVPIIEATAQSWYACQDGVWYQATSATGPWTVATYVPPVIYTIPPDSPLHYVTYVQIYGTSPDNVYEGYTPGYMGTEVADDGTVVYGTGYDYSPWIGDVWYGPPVTWGWGFDDCWTPWWGWGYGCGFGWGWGWFPPDPYWCGFGHYGYDRWHYGDGRWHGGTGGWANTGASVYRHSGAWAADGAFGRSHNFNGYGQAYNSRTGWLQAGQRAPVQNAGGAAWQRGFAERGGMFRNSAPGGYGGWNGNNPHGAAWSGNSGRSYLDYPMGNWNGRNHAQGQGSFEPHSGAGGGWASHGHGGGGFRAGGGGFHGGGGGGGFHGGGGGGHGGGGGGGHGGR